MSSRPPAAQSSRPPPFPSSFPPAIQSSYPPAAQSSDLQRLDCRVYTFAGWVSGTLLFTTNALLLDYLNRNETVLRLGDARIPGQEKRHPTFIVERAAVIAVVPDDLVHKPEIERHLISSRRLIEHRVSWLLPGGGIVEGALDMLEGVHMDEFLAHRTKFLALRDCTLFLPDGAGGTTVEPAVPWVALQTNRAVGVSEIG